MICSDGLSRSNRQDEIFDGAAILYDIRQMNTIHSSRLNNRVFRQDIRYDRPIVRIIHNARDSREKIDREVPV
jgi:hypothetical protein